jgi:acyl-CoA synthetase (NDP forming)
MSRPLFRHHDPDWETNGPAARRERRRRRVRGTVAFLTAVTAVAAAAFAWSIELGIAAGVGIRVALPIG